MKKFTLLLSIIVFGLWGCSDDDNGSATRDVATALNASNAAWDAAFNSADADAVAALYDADASISAGDGVFIDLVTFNDLLNVFFNDFGATDHELAIIESTGSGNLATQIMTWSATTNGGAIGGAASQVLKQDDNGVYKIIYHVWNNFPAPATVDVTAQLVAGNAAWDAAFNSADADAVAALYDAEAVISAGDGVTRDVPSLKDLLNIFFNDFGATDHELTIVESMGSGNLATQVLTWAATTNGGVIGGVASQVLKQDDNGDYKIIYHVWNSLP